MLVFISYLTLATLRQSGIVSLDLRQDSRSSANLGLTEFMARLHSRYSGLSTFQDHYNDADLSVSLARADLSTLHAGSTLKEGADGQTLKEGAASSFTSMNEQKRLLKQNSSRPGLVNDSECLQWVHLAPKPPYFLTAVLLTRIYEKDKAKLTSAELKMWLQYLRYAGVEHVYIYDAFVYQSESQLPHLKEFLKDGYVTYVDWHKYNPYTISGTQVKAYQNCINVYQKESQWQAAIDIDEYPFSPRDQSPGFLSRYMKQYEKTYPDVSELSMQNFLFLGKPLNKELMIERVMRRTPQRSNVLSKPIYRTANIHSASVHHNSIQRGRSANAPQRELRLNHYWGARLQNWGNDTEETLKITIPDDSMKPIIRAFKQCDMRVRRYLQ